MIQQSKTVTGTNTVTITSAALTVTEIRECKSHREIHTNTFSNCGNLTHNLTFILVHIYGLCLEKLIVPGARAPFRGR